VNRRLYRSQTESILGGVAGGVAEYFDQDPAIVRAVWVLLALITGGAFLLLYIVMWVVVPLPPESDEAPAPAPSAEGGAAPAWNAQPPPARRRSGSGSWLFGLILIGLGLYFLAREYLPNINFDRLWPLGLVVLGLILLYGAIRRRPA
jgi:phage shock protein C